MIAMMSDDILKIIAMRRLLAQATKDKKPEYQREYEHTLKHIDDENCG